MYLIMLPLCSEQESKHDEDYGSSQSVSTNIRHWEMIDIPIVMEEICRKSKFWNFVSKNTIFVVHFQKWKFVFQN